MSVMARTARRLGAQLRRRDGTLTRDLVLEPARFGLGRVPGRRLPDATTTVVCGFCSTGCGLDVHLKDGRAVSLSPSVRYPVNRGVACPKGWEALAVLDAPDRATEPLLRGADGRLRPVGWHDAMEAFVRGVRGVQERHGPEAMAFLGTGQITTEELAFLGTLAKVGLGMVHGDGNTRQCMATAATAYKQSFGFDAPPFSYDDLVESDLLFFVGANPCIAHPILWEHVCRNPHDPRIVVIDPRRTETAMAATHHVALAPKSDLALLYAIAQVLVEQGWVDRGYVDRHTVGFEAFARHVARFTPEAVRERTGIEPARIRELARLVHEGRRVSFWWTMGVNQSFEGTRVAQALIDLALLTGNIGRPGTGANSITGQCNAMGSRLYSNTSSLLGGRDFADATHRAEVAGALGVPLERIPDRAGLAYDQILEGIDRGEIRGLWFVATNGAHSWIDQERTRDRLAKLDFLVVQDMYASTETARGADLVLPAAGWGEKEGTFINSERRIALTKRVRRAPGTARSDFTIFRLIAHHAGLGEMFREWRTPEEVFGILRRVSRGRPCDITGIDGYEMLDRLGGVQWPFTEADRAAGDPGASRRLFADGRFPHADGRARFLFDDPRPLPEPTCEGYPLTLLTGRGSVAEWHTGTRTSKSALLRSLSASGTWLEIHPEDARSRGIAHGDALVVRSRRGAVSARALVTASVGVGNVFLPMHDGATNRLTLETVDPHSRQPSYKACAVEVRAHARERRAARSS